MSEDKTITVELNFNETRRVVAGLQIMQAGMTENLEDPNFEDAVEPIQDEIQQTRDLIQKIRDSGHNISDTSY